MTVEQLKRVLNSVSDDSEIWLNDDFQVDKVEIDFCTGYLTFVVPEVKNTNK